MPKTNIDPVFRAIAKLSRVAAIDILDNAMGLTCYDRESVDDLRALVAKHYKAGEISENAIL